MKTGKTIMILTLGIILLSGCSKTENDPKDIASLISGTYAGTYSYSGGSVSEAQVSLSRITDSTVTLSATVAGSYRYSRKVKASYDAYGTISLIYEGFNDAIFGVVDDNELSYSHNFNTFVGIKQEN